MHHLRSNPVDHTTSSRGSIVLISSTSGYFGGTSVVSYIASKHGVIGLLRASQKAASQYQVRLNAVAPFFTPTHVTSGYSAMWFEKGLPANSTSDVAASIVQTAIDPTLSGNCCLVAGKQMKEIEKRLGEIVPEWIGDDMYRIMTDAAKFFDEIGGYPLPPVRK
jgi:NAD(P)-dependent dehydrogenase (short-subunit alcohol dehydrogenase family)